MEREAVIAQGSASIRKSPFLSPAMAMARYLQMVEENKDMIFAESNPLPNVGEGGLQHRRSRSRTHQRILRQVLWEECDIPTHPNASEIALMKELCQSVSKFRMRFEECSRLKDVICTTLYSSCRRTANWALIQLRPYIPVMHSDLFSESPIDREERSKRDSTNLVKKMRHVQYVNFDDAWDLATEFVLSDDWMEQWCGVILSTGARMAEVGSVKIGFVECLTPRPSRDHWITQLAKLKSDETAVSITKPIMGFLTSSDIIHAVMNIRYHIAEQFDKNEHDIRSPAQINAAFSKKMSDIASRMFPENRAVSDTHRTRFGTHFLRAVYANLAWELMKDHVTCNQTRLIADYLGHSELDVTTAQHYQCIIIGHSKYHQVMDPFAQIIKPKE
jgi:telomere resolvase